MKVLPALLILSPVAATAQAIPPGDWNVTSRIVDLTMPGVPGFVARMIRGKSTTEHKRLTAGQGTEALLAPSPKARCRIEQQRIADGRYAQTLSCPQKHGEPMHVERTGTYDASGFVGRATVTGTMRKRAVTIVLDQRAAPAGGRARPAPDVR